ncbi:M28 family peptidase [Archangium violaceum]|uniref:Vacuolar membrane protease n=1 Tax=Archangium violaceum Cb vi76 TaxID=1406225 RepID=A0A084SJJ4_9BACT|nr:M28 family peptidase [Archangium violaceum]KFA88629.1 hypothetical protein Q664_40100 [Archangium violaceum Cb vi76]
MHAQTPTSWSRPALASGVVALLSLTLAGLASLIARPPEPAPANAPATTFSEARALPLVRELTEDIGPRVTGTRSAALTVEVLLGALRSIPGVAVEVQDTSGVHVDPTGALVYRARNVLARVPGRRTEAVLVAAHYDTAPGIVGAGDNAAPVAAAVEVARALALGPPLERSVVFNFSDGEEAGGSGAAAFLHHPWTRDVVAFLNLDSAGPGGRTLVFQSAGGLVAAYASAAPLPFGTVLAQDIFQAGLVPSGTDFEIYRPAYPRGLDLALYEDGYAYHTPLDRLERLEPGSLQHLGDSVLATVRELATHGPPPEGGNVFYDLAGRTMLVYSRGTALALAVVTLAAAVMAVGVALRRRAFTARELGGAVASTFAGLLLGVVLPMVAALVLAYVLRRPHGWYAAPWTAVACFGAFALAGSWLGRAPFSGDRAGWAGGVVGWAALLALATVFGVGSGYLALWAVAWGAAALLLGTWLPRYRSAIQAIAFAPPALLLAEAASDVLRVFIPVAGRIPLAIPFDPILAALVALPFATGAMLGLSLAPAAPSWRAGLLCLATGAVLLVPMARFPYTREHPKRITVEYLEAEGQQPELLIRSRDSVPPPESLGPAMEGVPGVRLEREGRLLRARLATPALPMPAVEVTPSGVAGPERTVSLRVGPGDYTLLDLKVPRGALAGWSLDAPLPQAPGGDSTWIRVVNPPRDGWSIQLQLHGETPVPAELVVRYADLPSHVAGVSAALPDWMVARTDVARSTPLKL